MSIVSQVEASPATVLATLNRSDVLPVVPFSIPCQRELSTPEPSASQTATIQTQCPKQKIESSNDIHELMDLRTGIHTHNTRQPHSGRACSRRATIQSPVSAVLSGSRRALSGHRCGGEGGAQHAPAPSWDTPKQTHRNIKPAQEPATTVALPSMQNSLASDPSNPQPQHATARHSRVLHAAAFDPGQTAAMPLRAHVKAAHACGLLHSHTKPRRARGSASREHNRPLATSPAVPDFGRPPGCRLPCSSHVRPKTGPCAAAATGRRQPPRPRGCGDRTGPRVCSAPSDGPHAVRCRHSPYHGDSRHVLIVSVPIGHHDFANSAIKSARTGLAATALRQRRRHGPSAEPRAPQA